MLVKLISPIVTLRPMDSALKRQMSPSLALLTLAALTPAQHEVVLVDENVQPIRLDDAPDLVGVSVKADTFERACEIAAAYRRRKIPVVFGGIHPTACPEANRPHCDALVIGEAESVWAQLLQDAEAQNLREIYQSDVLSDLCDVPVPQWDRINRRQYLYTNTLTIGRGCRYRCDFCYNSSPNMPRGYRSKPIDNVLKEIASLPDRHVMFIDDNFISDPQYARRLLKQLRALDLTWHTAVSMDILDYPDILDLMAVSGCQSLFIGFESLDSENLCSAGKHHNRVGDYERLIQAIHERGMMVNASVVFGFDNDRPSVFGRTTDWLTAQKVDSMTAHILTPYPGTRLYRNLLEEGRIFDFDLKHYNTSRAVFHPRGMCADELESGYLEAYRTFYSMRSIFERMPFGTDRLKPYVLFNFGYRKFGKLTAIPGRFYFMRSIGRLAARLSYGRLRGKGMRAAGLPETVDLPGEEAAGAAEQ